MAKDRLQYFRPEAKELLEGLGGGMLELEKGQRIAEVLPELLRLAHTLKGAAGVVKLQGIAERAHRFEETLAPHRGKAAVPREAIDQGLRLLAEMMKELNALDPAPPLRKEAAEEPAPARSSGTIRVETGDLDALVDGLTEVGTRVEAFRQAVSQFDEARLRLLELTMETGGSAKPASEAGPHQGRQGRVLRLASQLRATVTEVHRRLSTGIQRLQHELTVVRSRADRLRLIQASSLFPELERAVRDTAQSTGKAAVFETRGGEHRLDAHVLSHLRGALLHLVRNAVVHGIEDSAFRQAAGKNPTGKVSLEIECRGYCVSFKCADDGRGVDLESVRRAAIEQRFLSPEEADKLDLNQALRLIFRPGLTTTREANLVSGRGLGLDVVRDVAGKLKGHAAARTKPGQGTAVEVVVPVSLTSLETLLLERGGVAFSLPLGSVRRIHRMSRSEVISSPEGESILDEGQAVPFRDMAAIFGDRVERWANEAACSAVVVQSEAGPVAIGVDRVLGARHEIIRPLPPGAGALPLLTGASFDPDGNPRLVFDPRGLAEVVRRAEAPLPDSKSESRLPILIVDDSVTTRMLEQTILEANGYEVDFAVSGEEAFQKVRKRRYGLMLVDVEMPGMNGFEVLEKARLDPELRNVPAILVTTRSSPDDRRRGMEAGARAYLLKTDFDEGLLLQTIRGLIG